MLLLLGRVRVVHLEGVNAHGLKVRSTGVQMQARVTGCEDLRMMRGNHRSVQEVVVTMRDFEVLSV